jgi:hypothetical protein
MCFMFIAFHAQEIDYQKYTQDQSNYHFGTKNIFSTNTTAQAYRQSMSQIA